MNENIKIRRFANAPGNNYTIPKSESDRIIKEYDKSLFDKTKWIRFRMTGEGQGVEGDFGYYKDDKNVQYYYIEQHSFQTPTNKNTQYKNLFLYCEVDENGNAISKVKIKPGADTFPFIAKTAVEEKFTISPTIKVIMCGRFIQDVLNTLERT